jgi:hypothetical protein
VPDVQSCLRHFREGKKATGESHQLLLVGVLRGGDDYLRLDPLAPVDPAPEVEYRCARKGRRSTTTFLGIASSLGNTAFASAISLFGEKYA